MKQTLLRKSILGESYNQLKIMSIFFGLNVLEKIELISIKRNLHKQKDRFKVKSNKYANFNKKCLI